MKGSSQGRIPSSEKEESHKNRYWDNEQWNLSTTAGCNNPTFFPAGSLPTL